MERIYGKSIRCENCNGYLFQYLKKVYSDGSDEIVCDKCGLGTKIVQNMK